MDRIQKLGNLVRTARKAQKLTQEQLAAMAGVGVRFVREMEQGKETCHIGKVVRVIAMLGLNIHIQGEIL
jgi:y4mF family transcriptional regulator